MIDDDDCFSEQIVKASCYAKIAENNLGGHIDMEDFDLSLKWSKIGNFRMHLIEVSSSCLYT